MAHARTPDGTIRKLFVTDLLLFRDHLLRLDAETRRNRFIGAVNDAYLVQYAQHCFAGKGIVFGHIDGGLVRGAAELQPFDASGRVEAEAAFSVEPAYRRAGIGGALFERLIVAARNRGVRRLTMNCLAHNTAMRALARKYRAELTVDGWETVGNIAANGPTPFTLIGEAMDDARGFATAAIDLQRRIWLAPRAVPSA